MFFPWMFSSLVSIILRILSKISQRNYVGESAKGSRTGGFLVRDGKSSPGQDWGNRGWLEEMEKAILTPLIAWVYWSLACQECP